MPHVVVIHWDKNTLRAVVASRRVAHLEVDAVIAIPLEETGDAKRMGQQLKKALAPHRPGRAKVVLAISRNLLTWQHLNLPPCPHEDLPDLVSLQAGFESAGTGEPMGFDFLPLSGDHQTPHQVLAISMQAEELTLLQDICEAADLMPKRFVPLSLGWPAVARRATRGDEQPISIFVAPFAQEATLWATLDERLVLFRQMHFSSTDDLPALSAAVASELRRTFLALSQQHPEQSGAKAWIVGKGPEQVSQLAESIDKQLELDVQPMDFASDGALLSTKEDTEAATSDTLPLAGLALDEAAGNAPPVDLLHPRQRPAPRAGQRTYLLAATVLLTLLSYGGWLGYTELHAPVEIADTARAELVLLAESEESLRIDEQFAASISDWQGDSVNLLTELQKLSGRLRPLPLDAKEFNVEQDVVLKKLDIAGTRLDMEVALRTYPAVADLEARLREGAGRVQRDTAEENEDPPNYLWLIRASVDFNGEADKPKNE